MSQTGGIDWGWAIMMYTILACMLAWGIAELYQLWKRR